MRFWYYMQPYKRNMTLQTCMYSYLVARDAQDLVEDLSTSIDDVCEQRGFRRDCADAQARLNLRCSHL